VKYSFKYIQIDLKELMNGFRIPSYIFKLHLIYHQIGKDK